MRDAIHGALAAVKGALLEPEEFARRYRDGEVRYGGAVWLALLATAAFGTTTYGLTMGILGGPAEIVRCAILFTISAGLAWAIPLPAIYILGSFTGSRLDFGSTALAALVTVSFGGLAMLASIPVNWFFTVAIPNPGFVLLVNVVVFLGVGVAMGDVFGRVFKRLEPDRGRAPVLFLGLVAAIGIELYFAFDLFRFAAA